MLSERPVLVFGNWRGEPRGQVVVEGRAAGGSYREALPVGVHRDATTHRKDKPAAL